MRRNNYQVVEFAALSGTASFSSSTSIDVEKCDFANIQATSATNLVGTLKLQSSNDGVKWNDIPDATYAFNGDDSAQFALSNFAYPLVMLVWTRTSGTGTFRVTCNRKT